jgi:protein PhnA
VARGAKGKAEEERHMAADEVRDSVGNLLADGDQVTLIKDLTSRARGRR